MKKRGANKEQLSVVLLLLLISLGFVSIVANIGARPTGRASYTAELPEKLEKDEQVEKTEEPVLKEPEQADPETVYVTIQDLSFHPNEINITRGTTVVWVNKDIIGANERVHMVAAHYNHFRSKRIGFEDEFKVRFNQKGSYTYVDPIYKSGTGLAMKMGTVNVM